VVDSYRTSDLLEGENMSPTLHGEERKDQEWTLTRWVKHKGAAKRKTKEGKRERSP